MNFVFTDHVRRSLVRSFLSSNLSLLDSFNSGGGFSGNNSWGSSGGNWEGGKGETSNSGGDESTNLGSMVDDVSADGMGGLGVNMDLRDVLDLVVDVDSDLSDNWGSHNMLTDLVDRDNGLVDCVLDGGNRGSSIGNSGGSSIGGGNSRGSSNNWGSSNSWGSSVLSGNSWGSSVGGSWKNSIADNGSSYTSKTSISCKSSISWKSSISSSQELGLSISCGGSEGGGHKGRQSDLKMKYLKQIDR